MSSRPAERIGFLGLGIMGSRMAANVARAGYALDVWTHTLGESEVVLLDAPVTGSSPRAEDGTLTIMVGGDRAGFERAQPVLQTMGRLVVHVGELGQGQMLKLINNALAAANASALAEALLL